jgi:DNA-binding PadR family transcriptional regulator
MEMTRIPELGRFAEPALLILVSLSEGPKHGYAMMADIEAGTGRPMGPGTLYAALARLEARGLVEPLAPSIGAGPTGSRRSGRRSFGSS